MNDSNRKEGYWYSPAQPNLPKPIQHEKPVKNKAKIVARMKTVAANFSGGMQKGFSTCRICKERNGSCDVSYNGFTWPIGYIHYVEKHNVHPTQEFLLALFSGSLRGKRPKKNNSKNNNGNETINNIFSNSALLKTQQNLLREIDSAIEEMKQIKNFIKFMTKKAIQGKAPKKKINRLTKSK